jgi:geranylgeranyl diphosphate synthase type II
MPPDAGRRFDLAGYLEARSRRVDRALDRLLLGARVEPPLIHAAMRYSVFAGGKRLRPVLCLAAAELCGGSAEKVMPTACGLELIHTYSLVHDDLPALDDDDFRRGRPTSHKKFGEGNAVLAGDALLTRGFELLARNARVPGVKASAVLRVIETVAEAAGTLGMVGGQVADLEMEGRGKAPRKDAFHRRKLDYIHRSKTAALLRASLRAGALLAGGNPARVRALDEYGRAVGLAFQIADDVLDIVGDKKLLGKRGSDRENGKLTYPSLYGLDASRARARAETARAHRALLPFGAAAAALHALADYIIERRK